MELLLLSNSTNFGEAMYSHAAEAFVELAGRDQVVFVPYALADWDDYGARAIGAFADFGIDATSAHLSSEPDRAILEAKVVMMGGGNTFRLLDSLYAIDVLDGLAARVRAGETRYAGASAGTNVACPTICTTNDMPICSPLKLDALGLIPFQINLHYFDADPDSTYMGETRDTRIEEFLEENDCPVLALYEGSWLRVGSDQAEVTGPAKMFQRGNCDFYADGADVSAFLSLSPHFDGGRRPGNTPTSSNPR